MSDKIHLSIIVYAHSDVDVLWDLLNSIEQQTCKNIELFCLCSLSDASIGKDIDGFCLKSSNYFALDMDGLDKCAVLNDTIVAANGKYIIFVDDSCCLDFSYAQVALEMIKSSDADILKNNYLRFGADDDIDRHTKIHTFSAMDAGLASPTKKDNLFFTHNISGKASMYKRDFLLRENLKFSFIDNGIDNDFAFNAKAIFRAKNILINEGAYSFYKELDSYDLQKLEQSIERVVNFQISDVVDGEGTKPEEDDTAKLCTYLEKAKLKYIYRLIKNLPRSLAVEKHKALCDSKGKLFNLEFCETPIHTYIVDLSSISFEDIDSSIKNLVRYLESDDEVLFVGFGLEDSVLQKIEELGEQDSRFVNLLMLSKCTFAGVIDPANIRTSEFIYIDARCLIKRRYFKKALKHLSESQAGSSVVFRNSKNSDSGNADALSTVPAMTKHSAAIISSKLFSVYLLNSSLFNNFYGKCLEKTILKCGFARLADRKNKSVFCDSYKNKMSNKYFYDSLSLFKLLKNFASEQKDFDAKIALFRELTPLWSCVKQVKNTVRYYNDAFDINILESYAPGVAVIDNRSQNNPKISVIVPVYNNEKYLEECLNSIFSQDLQELECICIDDGSSDASLDLLREYQKCESRLVVLSQINSGVSIARNVAMKYARGQYLAFIDSDDLFASENVLSSLYEQAILNDADICGGSLATFDEQGNIQSEFGGSSSFYKIKNNAWIDAKYCKTDYGWIRFIYKKSLLEDNNIRFNDRLFYEDPEFFISALSVAKKIYGVAICAYMYRVDYKKTKWNKIMLLDCFEAIGKNLDFAESVGNRELFNGIVRRFEWDFKEAIVENLDSSVLLSYASELMVKINKSPLLQRRRISADSKCPFVLPWG